MAPAVILILLFLVTGCASTAPFHHENASGHYSSDIQQCALYARSLTGVQLYGDAYSWWEQAQHHYERGQTPKSGAILVLKKTSRMTSGHVAVVKDILGPRAINVTHSNWGDSRHTRHIIYESMRVEDASAANDWTSVRFWNDSAQVMGNPYAAYGFIYP